MRDRKVIDAELRLLAAVRRSIREHGGEPSSRQVDELLDKRLVLSGASDVAQVRPTRSVRIWQMSLAVGIMAPGPICGIGPPPQR
jgi:hypothetical protein